MADEAESSRAERSSRRSRLKTATKKTLPIAEEAEPKERKDETEKPSSPVRNASSPDPNCAICLSKLENKSFTDSCFHMFCFVCLLEWSKIKAECPLCKQPFKSIIHNVRSYDDYDQYHLERPENHNSFDSPGGRRFRYRTTLTQDHVFSIQFHHSRHPDLSMSLPTTITTRQHWRRQRQTATSDFRRRIYTNGMWVVGIRESSGRTRNITPEFFASNPATSHRLVPWLNRELNALLYNNVEHVQFVLELIMDLIKRFPIQSEEFYQHIYPFVGRHTRHFMHELESFAKSPFGITSYDQKAVYEQQPESISDSDSDMSVRSNDGNDSDVMIVSESPAPLGRRRDDSRIDRQRFAQTDVPVTPHSVSLRDLLEEDDERVTSVSGWDSPIAGPSWRLADYHTAQNEHSSSFMSDLANSGPASSSVNDAKDCDPSDGEGVQSENDVICVGYEKPWEERSPVVVSSDDNMMPEDVKKKHKSKPLKTKEESKDDELRHQSESTSYSRHLRKRSRSSSSLSDYDSRSSSRSKSRRYSERTKSPSQTQRHRHSQSRSRYRARGYSRSLAYEDAFGYAQLTHNMHERSSKHAHHKRPRNRHYNSSSRSRSRSKSRSTSVSRHKHRKHKTKKNSRNRRYSRSSSIEISSRTRHKKHKKHKKRRESNKSSISKDVQYKIIENSVKNSEPSLSITIKKDKLDQNSVVTSTVPSSGVASKVSLPGSVIQAQLSIDSTSNENCNISTRTREKSKDSDSSSTRKSDSRSSRHREKSFKKHPSGHKKSRNSKATASPDSMTNVLGVSSSSNSSGQRVPTSETMSHWLHGQTALNNGQTSQDSLIPRMMANFFDCRLHLYGYPSLGFGPFPGATSNQQPKSHEPSQDSVVVSSGDDSDVVVESVKYPEEKNSSGDVLTDVLNSTWDRNIWEQIPSIFNDLEGHASVDAVEQINVDEIDSTDTASMAKPEEVTEVLDSDEETAEASLSKSRDKGIDQSESSFSKSETEMANLLGDSTTGNESYVSTDNISVGGAPGACEAVGSLVSQKKLSISTEVADASETDASSLDVGDASDLFLGKDTSMASTGVAPETSAGGTEASETDVSSLDVGDAGDLFVGKETSMASTVAAPETSAGRAETSETDVSSLDVGDAGDLFVAKETSMASTVAAPETSAGGAETSETDLSSLDVGDVGDLFVGKETSMASEAAIKACATDVNLQGETIVIYECNPVLNEQSVCLGVETAFKETGDHLREMERNNNDDEDVDESQPSEEENESAPISVALSLKVDVNSCSARTVESTVGAQSDIYVECSEISSDEFSCGEEAKNSCTESSKNLRRGNEELHEDEDAVTTSGVNQRSSSEEDDECSFESNNSSMLSIAQEKDQNSEDTSSSSSHNDEESAMNHAKMNIPLTSPHSPPGESRSSGEISDNSDNDKLYEDFSSSDSPSCLIDAAGSGVAADIGHAGDIELCLSEGEILSD